MRSLANIEDLQDGVSVVKFFATWCRPCKLYAPVFERVAALNPEAHFFEVDVDQDDEFKGAYGVGSVPYTIIFKNGEVVQTFPEATSTGRLDKAVKDVLSLPDANST